MSDPLTQSAVADAPAPAAAPLPTGDEFFARKPDTSALPSGDDFFARKVEGSPGLLSRIGGAMAKTAHQEYDFLTGGPEQENFIKSTPLGRILDAYGQGAKEGWGDAPLGISPENQKIMRDAGVWPGVQKSWSDSLKALNEGIMRPAAAGLDALYRTLSAGLRGMQGVAIQGGAEIGQPQLGRDIAALPEAFPTEIPGMIHEPPHAARLADLAKSRELGVIGEGEGAYMGTAERKPIDPEIQAQSAKAHAEEAAKAEPVPGAAAPGEAQPGQAGSETASVQPPAPDIHAVARQIAPDTFNEYDALDTRRETYRSWLSELRGKRDIDATADLDAQIETQRGKVAEATGRRLATAQDRLDNLTEQRANALEEANKGDTPDMAKIRAELQKADYRMRDLAPDVADAYRQAESMMPKAAPEVAQNAIDATARTANNAEPGTAPQTVSQETSAQPVAAPAQSLPADQVARVAEAQAGGVNISAQPVEPANAPKLGRPGMPERVYDIAGHVAARLREAGRPVEEADAAGALIQAHYRARAARFNGALGTAEDLYRDEGPTIRGQAQTVKERGLELAQKGGKTLDQAARGKIRFADGQAIITLFKNADASTVIHETGHQWLEELQSDAKNPSAPADLVKDAGTVRDWLGGKEGEPLTTRQHEKFARGFERYMMEGTAPTKALARVFAKFKQWLTTIYQTIAKLKSPINDEIRGVFDRMLAGPEHEPVIAGDLDRKPGFADNHERLAETVQGPDAAAARDQIRDHADAIASQEVPDEHAELNRAVAGEAGEQPVTGAPSDGNGPAGQSGASEAGNAAESGAQRAGGSDVNAQGDRSRKGLQAELKKAAVGKLPKRPMSLVQFIRKLGGISEDSGEVRGVDPSLIKPHTGITLDQAAEQAQEMGYLPEGQRADPFALVEALRGEVGGTPVYSRFDAEQVEAYRDALNVNNRISQMGDEFGVDPRGKTKEQFFNEVADRMSQDKRAELAAQEGDAFAAEMAEAERLAKEKAADVGEGETQLAAQPRSLEDLENEFRSEQAAAGAAEDASNPGGRLSGQGQGGGQEGAGSRGLGAGTKSAEPSGPSQLFTDEESHYVDKAGNIVLDNLNTTNDVREAIRDAAGRNNDFIDERRGVVTDQQALTLAEASGMTPAELDRRQIGEAFNKEQIFKLEKLFIQAGKAVSDAAKLAQSAGTEEALLAYGEAEARQQLVLDSIQAHASGVRAEAGRSLQAYAALKKMAGHAEAEAVAGILKDSAGRTLFQLRQRSQAIANLKDPAQVAGALRDMNKPGWGAYALEIFKNWLIAGPITHMTYAIGNTALALWKAVPETAGEAAVGAFVQHVMGRQEERAYFGEMGAQVYSIFKGQRDGWRAGWDSLKAGQTMALPHEALDTLTKADRAKYEALRARSPIGLPGATHEQALAQLGIDTNASTPFTNTKAVPDQFRIPFTNVNVTTYAGTIIRAPGERMVAPIHSYFRTIGYVQSIGRQAYRLATQEGLAGNNFSRRIGELTNRPTEEMMQTARHEATQQTLMGKGGDFTKKISSWVNWEPVLPLLGPTKPLAFIDPFVHISANIMEQAVLERGPIGALLSNKVKADINGMNGPLARNTAIARVGLGTSLSLVGGGLAMEGILTPSAPSDPREAAMSERVNGMPHSLRIGNTSIEVNRLGVLGFQLALSADLYHVASRIGQDDAAKIAGLIAHSISQNFLDEGFLRGPSDLLKATEDYDRYGARYLYNLISSFAVPFSVGASQIARQIDPYSRQARTLLDQIISKVPYASEGLQPRVDVWGEPVLNREFIGVYAKRIENDPVDRELKALGIYPAPVRDRINNVELTPQQYTEFATMAGRQAHQRLLAMVTTPGFSALPDIVKFENMNSVLNGPASARDIAANFMMMKYDAIRRAAQEAKTAPLRGEIPKRGTIKQAGQ